ncbi:MAG: hypothetical protein IJW63_07715 [Lachnospiraceae bacterium]|nr:hypothetical protein [Lachnospiraceae bacterium]
MKGLIFPCLVVAALFYHALVQGVIKKGKIREGYSALWICDLLLSIFGAALTLYIYRVTIMPLLTLRTLFFLMAFLLVTTLILILGPSGLKVMGVRAELSEEEKIRAEYRFNDTLEIVRNLLLLMLSIIPSFFSLAEKVPEYFTFLAVFSEGELCSVFCLTTFLLLLAICLRQTIFWLRNITYSSIETEWGLLKMEQARTYYKRRNLRI